jgi:hypothetical protein
MNSAPQTMSPVEKALVVIGAIYTLLIPWTPWPMDVCFGVFAALLLARLRNKRWDSPKRPAE